jgi:hypothetical protein
VDGKPVQIPVAEYADEHHGSCYRTYALDKVIHGNGLENFAEKTATLSESDWRTLVDTHMELK